ncbi:hypothetical protein VPH35_019501 [Triticum aestivum]
MCRPEPGYGVGYQEGNAGHNTPMVQMAYHEESKRVFGYTKKSDFRAEFYKVINHMLTEDEFESGWDMLLDKNKLRAHPYMTNLFEIRKKWAKRYFKIFLETAGGVCAIDATCVNLKSGLWWQVSLRMSKHKRGMACELASRLAWERLSNKKNGKNTAVPGVGWRHQRAMCMVLF